MAWLRIVTGEAPHSAFGWKPHVDGADAELPVGLLRVLPELPGRVVHLVEEAEVLRVAIGGVGASVSCRPAVSR